MSAPKSSSPMPVLQPWPVLRPRPHRLAPRAAAARSARTLPRRSQLALTRRKPAYRADARAAGLRRRPRPSPSAAQTSSSPCSRTPRPCATSTASNAADYAPAARNADRSPPSYNLLKLWRLDEPTATTASLSGVRPSAPSPQTAPGRFRGNTERRTLYAPTVTGRFRGQRQPRTSVATDSRDGGGHPRRRRSVPFAWKRQRCIVSWPTARIRKGAEAEVVARAVSDRLG